MRAVAMVVGLGLLAASAAPAAAEHKRKDPQTAKLLSGAGAGVSSALTLASFLATDPHNPYNKPLLIVGLATSIVTPSFGEWYSGQWLTYGMAVRGGAAALAGFAVTLTQADRCPTDMVDNSCSTIQGKGVAFLGIAAIAYVGGVFYDVLDAPDAADRYNSAHGFVILPGPMASTAGGLPGAGLFVRGQF